MSPLTTHFFTSPREGISYITSSSVSSRTVRRPRAPVLWLIASSAQASSASSVKTSSTPSMREEALELLEERVLRLRQDAAQLLLAQRLQADDQRQPADELRDQAVLEQVVVGDVLEQLVDAVLAASC